MNPLVSVVVITYNSGKYILNGLRSIESQTYDNIEVIISDDCSTDNTIEICKAWISENKTRFRRVELVEAPKNTGVAGNLNRGIRASKGKWIKTLSGDDTIPSDSIKCYLDYSAKNPKIDICCSKLHIYGNNDNEVNKIKAYYENLYTLIKDYKNQLNNYIKSHFIPGTGLFYKKKLWEDVGGFDENYPFCDEYPFCMSVLLRGYTIYFLDKELYCYQIQSDSLSNCFTKTRPRMNIRTFKDLRRFFINKRFGLLLKKGMIYNAVYQLLKYEYIWISTYKCGRNNK